MLSEEAGTQKGSGHRVLESGESFCEVAQHSQIRRQTNRVGWIIADSDEPVLDGLAIIKPKDVF